MNLDGTSWLTAYRDAIRGPSNIRLVLWLIKTLFPPGVEFGPKRTQHGIPEQLMTRQNNN